MSAGIVPSHKLNGNVYYSEDHYSGNIDTLINSPDDLYGGQLAHLNATGSSDWLTNGETHLEIKNVGWSFLVVRKARSGDSGSLGGNDGHYFSHGRSHDMADFSTGNGEMDDCG